MGKRKRKLKWEYDESGTKGYFASVGSKHFWLYLFLDDRPKPFILDCPRYVRIGEYATWEEADAAAWAIAEPYAKKLKAELEELGV